MTKMDSLGTVTAAATLETTRRTNAPTLYKVRRKRRPSSYKEAIWEPLYQALFPQWKEPRGGSPYEKGKEVSGQVIFDPKYVGETKLFQFDFTSDLAIGETISTQTVTASVYSGTDGSPSAIISGIASASGAIVSQKVTGGVLGVTYELLCTITTSLGQTVEKSAYLAVAPELL